MIVVLLRGKTKQVIATPSSAGWIKPGDEDWPCTVYKTDAAFITKWKQLEKARFKQAKIISSKPAKKATKKKYPVRISGAQDPLLTAFAAWLKKQVYGAVGYFELATGKVPKQIIDDISLVNSARTFLELPEGSLIVATAAGKIVFLDSEGGKPRVLADGLRQFFAKLAKGRTGVLDLDDKSATGRMSLAEWLAEQ